ncbi:MAG: hypothetical protein WC736_15950 [Gallionella sp.]|jgi:hypothetical protein
MDKGLDLTQRALRTATEELALFRSRLDREELAKVMSDTAPWAASIEDFRRWSDKIIAYLEGK